VSKSAAARRSRTWETDRDGANSTQIRPSRGVAETLAEPLARAQHDRYDDDVQLVDQPGTAVRREESPVQQRAADTERVLDAPRRPGGVAVEGDGDVVHPELAHVRETPDAGRTRRRGRVGGTLAVGACGPVHLPSWGS
jgi:hypothetical protein